jgi:parallel beta-helix repeat protein
VAAILVFAASQVAHATDYYVSNKSGFGAGTRDHPFGMADMPGPDTRLTKALEVLQPGDTLWFQGGEYAFKTAPGNSYYFLGYLRPARSGLRGKPISFRACRGETVTLSRAEGGQPLLGNGTAGPPLDYVGYEGFVVKGNVYRLTGKGAEVAYCEVIGQFADTADNHPGIRLERADGAWIHHNVIHGWKGKSGNSCAVQDYVSENCMIEDNYVYDNTLGLRDKDSGINNTYRRNLVVRNETDAFCGNNQGKYMKVTVCDNVLQGNVALGYLVDGTKVHDNLIFGKVLAGHWAGELWNSYLWNNIVVAPGNEVIGYRESKNDFIRDGERRHLRYLDYNFYTATPKYQFGRQTLTLEEMRRKGFETHSKVVSSAREIFADEKAYNLLPEWSKAGRHGDAPGPENIALILDLRRYGPAARDFKPTVGPSEKAP